MVRLFPVSQLFRLPGAIVMCLTQLYQVFKLLYSVPWRSNSPNPRFNRVPFNPLDFPETVLVTKVLCFWGLHILCHDSLFFSRQAKAEKRTLHDGRHNKFDHVGGRGGGDSPGRSCRIFRKDRMPPRSSTPYSAVRIHREWEVGMSPLPLCSALSSLLPMDWSRQARRKREKVLRQVKCSRDMESHTDESGGRLEMRRRCKLCRLA